MQQVTTLVVSWALVIILTQDLSILENLFASWKQIRKWLVVNYLANKTKWMDFRNIVDNAIGICASYDFGTVWTAQKERLELNDI